MEDLLEECRYGLKDQLQRRFVERLQEIGFTVTQALSLEAA
jgi:hypothetical protein